MTNQKNMMTMKNRFMLLSLLFGFGMAVSFTSCDDDDNNDDNNNTIDTGNVVVTENITENTTWTSDKVYQLGGRISLRPEPHLQLSLVPLLKVRRERVRMLLHLLWRVMLNLWLKEPLMLLLFLPLWPTKSLQPMWLPVILPVLIWNPM
jgi:hypothetical protein